MLNPPLFPGFSARTMSRPDERERRQPPGDSAGARDAAADAAGGASRAPAPSKTRRKAEMHSLQDMGEALVRLDAKRLGELAVAVALPERLYDAIVAARSITAWGGRKRQLQYVGKLMRTIDPEPIRQQLDLWARGHANDAARERLLERWRDRLLTETGALDALVQEYPGLDRPRFRSLIAQARDERDHGRPPHGCRALFRELRNLVARH